MATQLPGYKPVFPSSAAEIAQEANKLIEKSKNFYDSQASIPVSEVTVENFALKIADFDAITDTTNHVLGFVQHTFTDKEMRDASCEADKLISEHEVELEMKKELFDRFKAVQQRIQSGVESVTPEVARFIDRSVLDGVRNGLDLSEEKRERIKSIKSEMNRLSIEFSKNLSEDNTSLLFSREELTGMPDDFTNELDKDKDSGKLKVTVQYPHYFPIMKRASNPETRRRLELAFSSRCKDINLPIMQKLVSLRFEKASILGYSSHAEFVLETRMAKNPKVVKDFLSDLTEKLKPLQEKERSRLLQAKEQDCKEHGYEFDGKVNAWDVRYLTNKVEEQDYQVDHEKLKEYFPIEKVTEGLLAIYQKILGLKFARQKGCWVWHPDVSAYSVRDAASDELLGYFLLDLYPREGKYGHAACFSLQHSCLIGGQRQVSIAAVVANFTKPTAEKPSLLTHDEVETFFHEFGHAMHNNCALATVPRFSGTRVERDFVEAPSQMLENWVWSKESLQLMSGHYQTGDAIPDDLMRALVNSKLANTAFFNQRQITFGLFDQAIHANSVADIDVVKEYAKVMERIMGISPSDGSAFPATFNHLAGGYDAQYYGYMWSEVFSADMFSSRFGEDKLLDPEAGMAYRKFILQPGGSRDASDMLRDFLGRDPTPEAFLKMKGL